MSANRPNPLLLELFDSILIFLTKVSYNTFLAHQRAVSIVDKGTRLELLILRRLNGRKHAIPAISVHQTNQHHPGRINPVRPVHARARRRQVRYIFPRSHPVSAAALPSFTPPVLNATHRPGCRRLPRKQNATTGLTMRSGRNGMFVARSRRVGDRCASVAPRSVGQLGHTATRLMIAFVCSVALGWVAILLGWLD